MSKISPEVAWLMILGGTCLATGVVAWLSGAFHQDKVCGPKRLEDGVSSGWLGLVLGGLLVVSSAAASVRTKFFGVDQNKELAELFVYAMSMVAWVGMIGIMVRGGLRSLGVWPINFRNLWRGPVNIVLILPWVMLLGVIGTMVYMAMTGTEPVPHERLNEMKSATTTPWIKMLGVLSSAVGAPLLEEAMFRVTLQTMLVGALTGRRKVPGTDESLNPVMNPFIGRWMAVLATAFVFALLHQGQQPAFVPALFLLGVGLGYSYERTGNYWVPVLMHMIFNGFNLWMVTLAGK